MGKHFIKEWRRFRGITQEEMGERLGLSKAALSRVESGAQGYSQKLLEQLSKELWCSPADLIARDPNDELALEVSALSDEEREQLKAIIGVVKGRRDGQ